MANIPKSGFPEKSLLSKTIIVTFEDCAVVFYRRDVNAIDNTGNYLYETDI